MPATVTKDLELVPGYRLLERLGEGGFGEVWKAEAPGGLLKAVKIIHGCLQENGEEPARLNQELKALNRVRTVRHPFILSLERFDIIDGRLVIVMELADRSLWDRFLECRDRGLPGIPRDELLRYMEETAEALDVMNVQHDLQHLDIKPQNLFLLYNHVKVGDFGLVKDLEGMSARATSGVTAVYAPPETFGGVVSRFCDQYNLAVAYQELLTGRLPFEGNNSRQLMMQHVMGEPNLRPLPPGDRPIVARALAKKPEDRHPSCQAFVQALRQARTSDAGGEVAADAADATDNAPLRETPATQMLGPGPQCIPQVILGPEDDPPAEAPVRASPPAEAVARETASCRSSPTSPQRAPAPVAGAVAPLERPETTGDGVLFPALVLGLGGLGGQVLRQLRKALRKRSPNETWPHLRLLQLDTDPESVGQTLPGEPDAVLTADEVLLTRFHRPAHYLKRQKERQELEQWLPLTALTRVPRDQVTARGWRPLGRLAFVSAFPSVVARLRDELTACTAPDALAAVDRRTGLGLRTTRPRVYVVAGLAGGTGSGMFLDVGYAVRRLLRKLGYPRAEVVGLLLLPTPERTPEAARAVANAYAALAELQHFSAPKATFFSSCPDGGDGTGQPPYHRCVLLQLPAAADGPAAVRELTAQAGDFLCRDLTAPLGRSTDEGRAALAPPAARLPCHSFGAYSFSVPRRPLLQRVTHRLCQRLVSGWRVATPEALDENVRTFVADQLTRWELSPESLTRQLLEAAGTELGEAPDAFAEAAVGRWARGGPDCLARQPAAVRKAIAELDCLVNGPRPGDAAGPSRLVEAFREAGRTVAEEAEKRLAEVALGALVEPRFRLIGAEEIVQAHLRAALGESARQHAKRRAEHEERAAEIQQGMMPHMETLLQGGLFGWRRRARATDSLIELFREYAAAGRDGLLAEELSRISQDLQTGLNKYLLAVGCCHERLGSFLASVGDRTAGWVEHADIGLGRYLLPGGARTLDEAVSLVLDRLLPEEERALQEEVQGLIGAALRNHVHLCTAPPGLFQELKEAIDRQVAALAEMSLGRAHAAALYVEQHAADEEVSTDLAGAFDEAQSELAGAARAFREELCVLAVPPGPEGEQFKALVRQALPETPLREAGSTDDIVFYREQPHLLLTELPQLGLAAREVYNQVLASDPLGPHNRGDITAWLPADGSDR
jgi:serine/threonine protein kinase